jgi:predicted metalloprotease with PDZ domain
MPPSAQPTHRTHLPLACSLLLAAAAAHAQTPIQLRLDVTDAARHILHVTELLPAHAGPNTYEYPEWIPGEHLPGGPIDNLMGLVFHAGSPTGAVIPWRRDRVDMYAFHVDAPAGTTTLAVAFDVMGVASREDTTATAHMNAHVAMIESSDIVLYPAGIPVRNIPITATIHLPATWSAATALRVPASDAPTLNSPDTTFATVSVEQFVDSPILAGDHCRQYPLAPEIHPIHTLDVCSEKAADLDLQPAFLADMANLVRQNTAVFRSHHYDHYDYLVALSSHLAGDSLEHTQSAAYIVSSLDLTDAANAYFIGDLLPHENIHSWCGKYRRPADLATPDYHQPMQDDLLWVYEGLTQYYGHILSARAGFRTPAQVASEFDHEAWEVDQPGREWRSLQDTADASSILRGNEYTWFNWRRNQDYYREGALVWLEVDSIIRRLSDGKKSLDDFAAHFLGANPTGHHGDSGPGVFPYTFADVVRGLNDIAPYDWAGFWTDRLNTLTPRPPTAGLEASGYTYGDSETMDPAEAKGMGAAHMVEAYHSLGVMVRPTGVLVAVWMHSPAFQAGLAAGDKVTAVNGQPYTPDLLLKTIHDSKSTTAPIVLTAVRDDETVDYRIDYHGGDRFGSMHRNGNPDILTTVILQPLK